MIYPIRPYTIYEDDCLADIKIYKKLRERVRLPAGIISRSFSEITSFLYESGVDPNALAMRLRGYAIPSHDPDNIIERYSLAITLLETGRLKIDIIERWGKYNFAENKGMISALHGLWLPESVLFLPSEVEEFESLLNAIPPVPEEIYQKFFEAHPKWLYLLGEQYDKSLPQVKIPPIQIHHELALTTSCVDTMWLKPDFLLKRIGLDLWDVLDIKPSDCLMVVGSSSRRKFSEEVYHAVAQLREYSKRLQQNEIRAYMKRKYGLTICEPIAMVLIGRDFGFKTLQEKSQLKTAEGVRIFTYDDLLRLSRHRLLAL
jgi:hypothetical protein